MASFLASILREWACVLPGVGPSSDPSLVCLSAWSPLKGNTRQNEGSFRWTAQVELTFHENNRRDNLFSEFNFIIS